MPKKCMYCGKTWMKNRPYCNDMDRTDLLCVAVNIKKRQRELGDFNEFEKSATPPSKKRKIPNNQEKSIVQILKQMGDKINKSKQLFSQSPDRAGGYNPRSQHGSLGKTHTIGLQASKTGSAVSGHGAIVRSTSFRHRYLSLLNKELSQIQFVTSASSEAPPFPISIRSLYLNLQYLAASEIIKSLNENENENENEKPNNDNQYPCVLIPYLLTQDQLNKIKSANLTLKEENTQESYTTLMTCIFVYYADKLKFKSSIRSSFGHAQIAASACATHMRISPGALHPDDIDTVVHAIMLTNEFSKKLKEHERFIEYMKLRESTDKKKQKQKSALYNLTKRNLEKSFYGPKEKSEVFSKNYILGSKLEKQNMYTLIDWINSTAFLDTEKSYNYKIKDHINYTEKWNNFIDIYCKKMNIKRTKNERLIIESMNLIGQKRMLDYAIEKIEKRENNDDVSDSEGETDIEITSPKNSQKKLFHKKSPALNGIHCIHKIMDAIVQSREEKDISICYKIFNMYFETSGAFDKWFSLQRLKGHNVKRREKTNTKNKNPEEISIIFTDINHCNVSYEKRSEGIFKKEELAKYDYYILDITSAQPEKIKETIIYLLNLSPTATIFTISSLLKQGQLGADLFSQGEIRIFTLNKENREKLFNLMKICPNNQYLVEQECRRHMKSIGACLTFREIFPENTHPQNLMDISTDNTHQQTFSDAFSDGAHQQDLMDVYPANTHEITFLNFINENFKIIENEGDGNCLYLSFVQGLIGIPLANLPAAQRVREGSSKTVATLIKMGYCVSDEMFDSMNFNNMEYLKSIIVNVIREIDNINKNINESARIHFRIPREINIPAGLDGWKNTEYQISVGNTPYLKRQLQILAKHYALGQSEDGQFGGERDFNGLALNFQVNLLIHYKDTSGRGLLNNCHNIAHYNYKHLMKYYFNSDVEESTTTIHIIQSTPVHFELGIPKTPLMRYF